MHRTPDFFMIGAAKAGTTFLSSLLEQHPQICISNPKEPKFFTTCWNQGWDWYERCFEHAHGSQVRGDASTQYSITGVYPESVARIAEFAPSARLIYLVRDPFARLESQWVEDARSWKANGPSFADALRSNPEYIDATRYWAQYNAYREQFPESHIRVMFFDDLIADPITTARQCAQFLQINDAFEFDARAANQNAGTGKRQPRPLARFLYRTAPRASNWIKSQLSGSTLKLATRVAKTPIARPHWTADLEHWVRDQLEGDTRCLLRHFSREDLGWTQRSVTSA